MLLGGHSGEFHAHLLQYSLLHLAGYSGASRDDSKLFRQWGSKLLVTLDLRHGGQRGHHGRTCMGISSVLGLAAAASTESVVDSSC